MFARWIWSQIVNAVWWVFHPYRLPYALCEKETFPRTESGVTKWMRDFRYERDSFRDWSPWVITAIARKYDDCDGAAVIWHWAMNRIDDPKGGKVVFLKERSGDSGHAVYVSAPYEIVDVGMYRFVGSNSQSVLISDAGYPESLYNLWPDSDYIIV